MVRAYWGKAVLFFLTLQYVKVADSLQIVLMENPPYVCPDWSPCQPAYIGAEWTENSNLKNLSYWRAKSSDLLQGCFFTFEFSRETKKLILLNTHIDQMR